MDVPLDFFNADIATAMDEDARVGRAALRGAIAGFAGISALVALAGGLLCGLTWASAVSFGVFVGMWGGLGFGFMFGASWAGMHVMDSHDLRE